MHLIKLGCITNWSTEFSTAKITIDNSFSLNGQLRVVVYEPLRLIMYFKKLAFSNLDYT